MARIVGNDIASYQGDINYDVYRNNTNFVIMKVSEGVGFLDPKFKRNQAEARRVGLPLGYYHFARPNLKNTPEAEAQYFLSQIGEILPGEILVLDYEVQKIQADVLWCKKFLDYCFEKIGVRPLLYASESYITGLDWSIVANAGYGLWIAKYLFTPSPDGTFQTGAWKFAAMYQWTSSQKVPGIAGNVDGNIFYGDVATFKRYGKGGSTPPPPPADTTDWKKRYEDEVAAHEQTKRTIQEQINTAVKDALATLNARIDAAQK